MVTLGAIVVIAAALQWFDIGTSAETLPQSNRITIRTENYPRPPYSGATYYIYEREGETICTKLEVCNKYNNCSTSYTKGEFKEDEDVERLALRKRMLCPTASKTKSRCLKHSDFNARGDLYGSERDIGPLTHRVLILNGVSRRTVISRLVVCFQHLPSGRGLTVFGRSRSAWAR